MLDIVSKSFSSWWVKHVVATAVLIGVLTGFVAGELLDRRACNRNRARWSFLREQAAMSLCDAVEAASSAFGKADIERAGAGALSSDPPGKSSLATLKQAAETFRTRVAEWRNTLRETDDAALLQRCEEYERAVSAAVLFLERDQEGVPVFLSAGEAALDQAGYVLRVQEVYFTELQRELRDAQANRMLADAHRKVERYWRSQRSMKRRLQLWRAERTIASTARRAQRLSNEADTQVGEASDSEPGS